MSEIEGNGQGQPANFSEFLMALVHGLRTAGQMIRAMVNENEPGIVGHEDTTVVLIEGPKVADAMESIAQRLDAQDEEGEEGEEETQP